MSIDLNELAEQFARGSLTINGVYLTALQPGIKSGHTAAAPTAHAGFVFALRGQARFEFIDKAYELIPGRIMHGGKQMTFKLEVGPAGFEYGLVHYTLTDSAAEPLACTTRHYSLETGEHPSIVEQLALLHDAYSTPGHIQTIRSKELFYSILYEMLASARTQANKETKNIVEHALTYIHHHYMEPLTLQKLASISGLEPKPFAYWFHKYVGIFPIDYLIQHRMKRAKQLLAASNCSISTIAESVGYLDAHYFSRLFKKHVGTSPSSFRAQMGNHPLFFQESSISRS